MSRPLPVIEYIGEPQFGEDCTEAEYAEFWAFRFLAETMPHTKAFAKRLDEGPDIGTALAIREQSFSDLALLWWGLPPAEREKMVAKLAPKWAVLRRMMDENKAKAKAILARRQSNGHR